MKFSYKNYRWWLVHHISKQKLLLTANILGIGLVTFSRVVVPIIVGYIVDTAILVNDPALLLRLLVIFLVVSIARNVMDYATMMIGHYLGLHVEKDMRQEFFDVLQSKPLRYHDMAHSGDLQALATNDLRKINTMVSHGSFYIYPFFQTAMVILLVYTTLDTRLALVITPFIAIYVYFALNYAKRIKPFAAGRMVKHSNLSVKLQDNLTGISTIKSFTAEDLEKERFREAVHGYRDIRVGEARVQSKFYPLLIIQAAIGTVFLISAIFLFQGTISLGTLTAANLLLTTLIHPTGMIFWATNDALSGFAACARLFDYLTMETDEEMEEKEVLEEATWPASFNGRIEFRNVTFYYEGNGKQKPVLESVSFTIEPDQRVSLVGPTGCGKTTLVKLLLRLYDPQEGVILLDGKDIKTYPIETLRRKVGYVEQDIYLFSRSISKNIAFGRPGATQEQIIEVAKQAQVDDFVRELPDQYGTIVGERGTRLSGGEKQRVAIARALLTDPEILILDDSASAVDSKTEEKISRAIDNVAASRTTIIITHRLHTIRNSDKIIVLKQGQIAAIGGHEKLLTTSTDYQRIFGKHTHLPEVQIA